MRNLCLGAASRTILDLRPRSTAILADYSAEMMRAGERQMQRFAGRYRYVEFDMSAGGGWPAAIPAALDAVVTSMCVHHLPDQRKQGLFAEIFDRLVPGGWYLNYDPVRAADPVVEATWERVSAHDDPEAAARRRNRTPLEQARWDNHIRRGGTARRAGLRRRDPRSARLPGRPPHPTVAPAPSASTSPRPSPSSPSWSNASPPR